MQINVIMQITISGNWEILIDTHGWNYVDWHYCTSQEVHELWTIFYLTNNSVHLSLATVVRKNTFFVFMVAKDIYLINVACKIPFISKKFRRTFWVFFSMEKWLWCSLILNRKSRKDYFPETKPVSITDRICTRTVIYLFGNLTGRCSYLDVPSIHHHWKQTLICLFFVQHVPSTFEPS